MAIKEVITLEGVNAHAATAMATCGSSPRRNTRRFDPLRLEIGQRLFAACRVAII
jgi:hypothetical protein